MQLLEHSETETPPLALPSTNFAWAQKLLGRRLEPELREILCEDLANLLDLLPGDPSEATYHVFQVLELAEHQCKLGDCEGVLTQFSHILAQVNKEDRMQALTLLAGITEKVTLENFSAIVDYLQSRSNCAAEKSLGEKKANEIKLQQIEQFTTDIVTIVHSVVSGARTGLMLDVLPRLCDGLAPSTNGSSFLTDALTIAKAMRPLGDQGTVAVENFSEIADALGAECNISNAAKYFDLLTDAPKHAGLSYWQASIAFYRTMPENIGWQGVSNTIKAVYAEALACEVRAPLAMQALVAASFDSDSIRTLEEAVQIIRVADRILKLIPGIPEKPSNDFIYSLFRNIPPDFIRAEGDLLVSAVEQISDDQVYLENGYVHFHKIIPHLAAVGMEESLHFILNKVSESSDGASHSQIFGTLLPNLLEGRENFKLEPASLKRLFAVTKELCSNLDEFYFLSDPLVAALLKIPDRKLISILECINVNAKRLANRPSVVGDLLCLRTLLPDFLSAVQPEKASRIVRERVTDLTDAIVCFGAYDCQTWIDRLQKSCATKGEHLGRIVPTVRALKQTVAGCPTIVQEFVFNKLNSFLPEGLSSEVAELIPTLRARLSVFLATPLDWQAKLIETPSITWSGQALSINALPYYEQRVARELGLSPFSSAVSDLAIKIDGKTDGVQSRDAHEPTDDRASIELQRTWQRLTSDLPVEKALELGNAIAAHVDRHSLSSEELESLVRKIRARAPELSEGQTPDKSTLDLITIAWLSRAHGPGRFTIKPEVLKARVAQWRPPANENIVAHASINFDIELGAPTRLIKNAKGIPQTLRTSNLTHAAQNAASVPARYKSLQVAAISKALAAPQWELEASPTWIKEFVPRLRDLIAHNGLFAPDVKLAVKLSLPYFYAHCAPELFNRPVPQEGAPLSEFHNFIDQHCRFLGHIFPSTLIENGLAANEALQLLQFTRYHDMLNERQRFVSASSTQNRVTIELVTSESVLDNLYDTNGENCIGNSYGIEINRPDFRALRMQIGPLNQIGCIYQLSASLENKGVLVLAGVEWRRGFLARVSSVDAAVSSLLSAVAQHAKERKLSGVYLHVPLESTESELADDGRIAQSESVREALWSACQKLGQPIVSIDTPIAFPATFKDLEKDSILPITKARLVATV